MVIQVLEAIPGWRLTPFTQALPDWKLAAFTTAEMTDVIVAAPGDRVSTHAAPLPVSPGPPMMAVFPSPDTATEAPYAWPARASLLTSLLPCCPQTPAAMRVKSHAPPTPPLS